MSVNNSMPRIWMGICLAVAVLSFFPAWTGRISWWMPGIAFALFAVFLLEPWFLTWQLRKRGEALQITDEGVLRRLVRGDSEYVRWSELREVSIVMTQGVNLSEEYFYVLAGTGTSGVIVGQALAAKYDLLSHLSKLPGFNHGNIATAMSSPVNQRFTLWRAAPLEGEAVALPFRALN
ncbi:MAG TPA: hypothetical protein VFS58_03720 [Steroidobacteraceae bacterium]|nr:hypothetical protein [Steroidobacteraceae bacterium]